MEPTIQQQPPQKNTKKIVAVIAGIVILLAAAIIFTITLLRSVERKDVDATQPETTQKVTREEADAEYKLGRDKQASGDIDNARVTLKKARTSYEQLGDKAKANEVAALIKLLDSQPKQTQPSKASPPASQPE